MTKGRLHVQMQLIEGVWVATGAIVAMDPTQNPNIELGVWSTFDARIATNQPELFERWKELMKDICRHAAATLNKKPLEETKLFDTNKLKDAN